LTFQSQIKTIRIFSQIDFQLGASDVSAPTESDALDNIDLDDTNGVAVILEDTGADTAAILVDADSTLMLTDTQIEAFTDGSVFSGWSDIDQIFLKAANANTQVEVVIATTE